MTERTYSSINWYRGVAFLLKKPKRYIAKLIKIVALNSRSFDFCFTEVEQSDYSTEVAQSDYSPKVGKSDYFTQVEQSDYLSLENGDSLCRALTFFLLK